MRPLFQITPQILNYATEISLLLGKFEGFHARYPQLSLKKENRIRTIQGSLAIEGNSLNLDQMTAILENKRVVGPKKEVLEVQNALQLYDRWDDFDPISITDL